MGDSIVLCTSPILLYLFVYTPYPHISTRLSTCQEFPREFPGDCVLAQVHTGIFMHFWQRGKNKGGSRPNVTKLRKAGSRRKAGPSFFVTFFKKHLTNQVKYAAFLLTAISKKAFVIRGVPTENYKEA